MKIRDVLEIIQRDGWYQVVQEGSHRQFKHPKKPGRVTISGHPGDDLGKDTLASVFKQARLRKPRRK